jgi:formamidopyrimidine-DNA glycosylase
MPELPDVEVFRRYLDSTALHKRIDSVSIKDDDVLEDISANRLRRDCRGRKLSRSRRHGKLLFVQLDKDPWLRLHFGMTGFLSYYRDSDGRPEYTRALFKLKNGYELAYVAKRKLGDVSLVDDVDDYIAEEKLGPDPLEDDLSASDFYELIDSKRGTVKSLLMNQSALAGIGNVYSDEILFQAELHPDTLVAALGRKERSKLWKTTTRVLKKAIDYQVDVSKFPRTYLLPNREDGASCPRCKGKIKRVKISGRSAYICNKHQRKLSSRNS